MKKSADKIPVAWVSTVPQEVATGDLARAYEAVKGKDGKVENLYLAMSQTPLAIKPADDHYLALLHNPDSPLKPWLAEFISTYVAILCGSEYAALNHGQNFRMYYGNNDRADQMLQSLHDDNWQALLKTDGRDVVSAIAYTRKLSLTPDKMSQVDVQGLRDVGFCDKSISYIVQLAASFAYWARMINGLGTQLGDNIGLSEVPYEE